MDRHEIAHRLFSAPRISVPVPVKVFVNLPVTVPVKDFVKVVTVVLRVYYGPVVTGGL